jgi:menaquinone-dependent protoporphyrinogen IX oxidase
LEMNGSCKITYTLVQFLRNIATTLSNTDFKFMNLNIQQKEKKDNNNNNNNKQKEIKQIQNGTVCQ